MSNNYKYIKVLIITIFSSLVYSCTGNVMDQSDKKLEKSNLGNIRFETSGSAEAQEQFIRGVLALHNYWYPEAKDAFKMAREIDSTFAMAYWGEAMSYNKTLWQVQDKDEALKVLSMLGESHEDRIKSDLLDVEKDFLESLTLLYGEEEDKLVRDKKYLAFMENMNDKYPGNDEVKAFYALALLGVLRDNQGNENIRMKCAAISQNIIDRNPQHPGALHYKVHALDDPLHAIMALDAAYKYSEVAPESNHALHMPSHIFLQLGMWDDVRKSNIASRAASENWVMDKGYSVVDKDDHSLAWLSYAYTQMGLFDKSQECLEKIRTDNLDSANRRSNHYMLDIMCRIWVEQSGDLKDFSLDFKDLNSVSEGSQAMLYFTKGWSFLENDKMDSCSKQIKLMNDLIQSFEEEDFDKKIVQIYFNELKGLYEYKKSGLNAALVFMNKAKDIEESLNAPTGPPDVIKPIHELFAEIYLKEEEYQKAIELYKVVLERTPNRSMSQLGIARAYRLSGDISSAKYHYEKFSESYSSTSNDKNQTEALSFIKNNENVTAMALNDSKVELPRYDQKNKITQCLPLN